MARDVGRSRSEDRLCAVFFHGGVRRRALAVSLLQKFEKPNVWGSRPSLVTPHAVVPAVFATVPAHLLRDVQYAIDCGDAVFAPRLRDLLRWAVRIGRCQGALRATTLRHYRTRAEHRLDALVAIPAAHPDGRELQTAVKAWRTKFFVFLEHPDVPASNNACERELCPSVVFRKVTGGCRSDWGVHIHAGYRSITGTARLHGQTALQATDHLLAGTFTPTPAAGAPAW